MVPEPAAVHLGAGQGDLLQPPLERGEAGAPCHVTESPHWLAAAERLLRDYDGELRHSVVGQLGIDPEALSTKAQPLLVEAAMKYA